MDQELETEYVYALTRWQHLSVLNDGMAAILKVWHEIDNLSQTIDAYLVE